MITLPTVTRANYNNYIEKIKTFPMLMPEGYAKKAVEKELKRLKERDDHNKEHIAAWEALDQIKKLKGNSKFRDITDVLNFFQGDRWEGKWNIVKLG